MTRIAGGVVALLLALPASIDAHRLDEYLQASRLSLARDSVTLEIDLTPGATIAADVASLVDRDADGRITPLEAEAYGRAVVREILVDVDGRQVALTPTRVEASSIAEMAEGMGTVRILAVGRLPEPVPAGRHRVQFRNNHHPASSVYLVNALVPRGPDVVIASQSRDVHQREIRLEFVVRSAWRGRLAWLALGLAGLTALVVVRRPRVGLRSLVSSL